VNEQRSDEEWADVYSDQRGVYDAFAESLEHLLRTLLEEDGVDYAWVSWFSRSPEAVASDLNRARRSGQVFDNPLESSLRVAGVNVVVETLAPVREIVELVSREFSVDAPASVSIEEAAARNDQHAYPYALVSLDERRRELAEWSRFAGLHLRVEVKTILQDAWEAIDLDFPFYEPGSYPGNVRDLLARCALGLAAVDTDLAEAKDAIARFLAEYEESIAAGELELPVNGVSMLAYMRTSELIQSLTDVAEDVGFPSEPDYVLDWADTYDMVWLLRRADIHTLAELQRFLQKATPRTRDTLASLLLVATDRGFVPSAQPDLVVELLWLVLGRADAETISLLRYRDEMAYALNTVIGNQTTLDSDAR
jgi:ppGpp synthetase/RelA/SpoT-type nucleotidyltranferase